MSRCASDAAAQPATARPVEATAVGTASAAWTHGFGSAMTLEAMIFAPYNLMSFRMIPSAFRPQTTAAACAGYTIALSSLC